MLHYNFFFLNQGITVLILKYYNRFYDKKITIIDLPVKISKLKIILIFS